MFETLHKYLILHKKLAIPGVGCFAIEHTPAEVEFVQKLVHPPLPEIRFSAKEATANKHFYHFLSRQLQLDETEAIHRFTDLSQHLQTQVKQQGVAVLPGIGEVKKESNKYSFQPAYTVNDYYPDVTAEFVIRKNAEHTIRVGEDYRTNTQMQELLVAHEDVAKDRWWIAAIVLTVIGIAGLLYHYYIKR